MVMNNGRFLLKQVQPPQSPPVLTNRGKKISTITCKGKFCRWEDDSYFQKSLNKLVLTHTLSQSLFTHTCLGVLSLYGVAFHLKILLTSASINIRPDCCSFFSCLEYIFLDGLTGEAVLFVMHFNFIFLLVLRSRIFYCQIIHAAAL